MLPQLAFAVAGTRVVFATHGLAIAAGVAAGGAVAAARAPRRGPALLAAALVAAATLVGAHALFWAVHGGRRGFWSGGLSSMGGVAMGLVAAWGAARLAREPLAPMLDALVPGALLALGIGRVGCFLGGCCLGRPTDLPWGVLFPELGPPPRHPLQLYSAAADLGLVALLLALEGPPGAVARLGCLGFGLVRAALDALRDPAAFDPLPGGVLTLAQAAGLGLALAAALAGRPCAFGSLRLRLGRPRAARASFDGGVTAWPTRRRSRT
ncbi:MAG TPA: prolipoprotein diacylglyceryl transferase family protein [Candidatus Binatia bacterium]|nr:prolipoprotein diacylglyceryl transferase family protein [Candidatus Binatia bacterium]